MLTGLSSSPESPKVLGGVSNNASGLHLLVYFCFIPESVCISAISQVFPCCHHLRTEQKGVKGGPVGTP